MGGRGRRARQPGGHRRYLASAEADSAFTFAWSQHLRAGLVSVVAARLEVSHYKQKEGPGPPFLCFWVLVASILLTSFWITSVSGLLRCFYWSLLRPISRLLLVSSYD